MEILHHPSDHRLELELKGRFDANWAEHVGAAIESAIRAGHHRIDLNLAQVDYLSSAGIRVLLKYFKRLREVQGSLRLVQTTAPVLSVLQLSGIATMLVVAPPAVAPEPDTKLSKRSGKKWESAGVTFESFDQFPGGELEGQLHGQPEDFGTGRLSGDQSHPIRFTASIFGLGLGAFGGGPENVRGRFGEFLATGGTAVAQPTDGSSVPDYVVTEGQFVPEVHLLYGLTANGRFSRLLRFEAAQSARRVISLSQLVEVALTNLETSGAGFTIVAECAAVVGATLRQSPALAGGQSPWNFPATRDWLTFTTERSEERNVVLIVGFAERATTTVSAAFMRPIGPDTSALGHFHAAVFPYRPVARGNLELKESVTSLLGTESAQAVLHLLADEREFEGVGQTDLMRGACWMAPLKKLERAPRT